jgi:Phosphoribulokinase / Uridine kinase family
MHSHCDNLFCHDVHVATLPSRHTPRLIFVLDRFDVMAKSLETELLVDHIVRLKAGEAVDVPRYDFSTHSRCPETTHQVPRRIILVEGERSLHRAVRDTSLCNVLSRE